MRSASGMGVRRPTARSFVKWSPPIATALVWRTTPPPYTINSVVPPPMSSKQQPRSRSSCVRQDSAEAKGSRTVSLIKIPARFAAVTRFWVDGADCPCQALADHPDRVANAFLRVHEKFMGEDVKHFAVLGKSDVSRGI